MSQHKGNISTACQLFDAIPVKDVVAWSVLIHGCATNGYYLQSLKAFSAMRMQGVLPNSFSLVGVLMGVACSGCLLPAQCIHGLIVKHGQLANVIVGTALLSSYARCPDCRSSYRVFSELRSPGLISYNARRNSAGKWERQFARREWRGDGSPGFYNLRCPGFVQTDSRYILGAPFPKISEYGGVQQVVTVHIAQDQETKHWWLIWANDVRLGYWPKELFPSMANGANRLFFGGLYRGVDWPESSNGKQLLPRQD
ncbi:hypothetical protein MLD38_027884 [Melastoma candidum]|uniref:Uncharacterized protein n=1 Tax=Melastoma candidum TaxID=119954 RepID=A0ACB9N0X5_9MYRT|nr:hypothetical protein MLD38_027884 [Melastoma candidum]